MTEIQNVVEGQTQPKIRDRLFIAIFGKDNERSKRWRLDLYNALNGTAYTDPDALTLNTIENVIYIKMYNDVSFLVDSQMTLYEQPARPERYKMRLSDAFELEDKSGDFEWTADVININPGKNESLVKSCKPMYDYVRLVGKISANKKAGMKIQRAVNEAVDWAIEENFLEGFVREQKEEIIGMYLTEFNEERAIRGWREEGRAEGALQKAVEDARSFYANGVSIDIIAKSLDMTVEQVKEIVSGESEAQAQAN